MARLLSVNVGLPRDIEWKGRTVHTGIWKDPLPGRWRVGRLNLDGDGQGDLAGHGGEQRAVFVYRRGSAGLPYPPPAGPAQNETPVPDHTRAGAASPAEPRFRHLRQSPSGAACGPD